MIRAAGRRPRGLCSRRGLVQRGCTPHFLFGLARKENGPCTVQREKALGALRCSGPPRATGVGVSVPAPIWAGLRARYASSASLQLPSRGGWCRPRRGGHRIELLLFSAAAGRWLMCSLQRWINATAPTPARAARSEAERAERGTGQMRPCTPTQDAPRRGNQPSSLHRTPPRPSVQSSQTRRHPLTPTPVQQLCTHVQSCDQKRSFLLDRARPVFFSSRWKRKWGPRCTPCDGDHAPCKGAAQFPPQAEPVRRTPPRRHCRVYSSKRPRPHGTPPINQR